MQLETTAFDVQFFISEHAQDLSPTQSKQLLRLLNATQKCFLDVQESVVAQVECVETQLQQEQDLDDQKVCLSLWSWNLLLLVLLCIHDDWYTVYELVDLSFDDSLEVVILCHGLFCLLRVGSIDAFSSIKE